jgi:putative flavoprotein involved in K+ transport
VVDYLRRYAERHALEVHTGVEVERVDRSGAGWILRTADGVIEAGRVVMATGYSNVPYLPDWPGASANSIVHSASYRNPVPYRERRMLVVGAGNSGAEIAVDLAEGGALEVLLAVRTPPAIVRRDTLGLPSQVLGVATARLPASVLDLVGATLRRFTIPNLASYGLPAPARPYSDFRRRKVIPILDVGLVDAVRTGRIRVVSALERFEAGTAILADGLRADVDTVIAATGFRTGLEPLVGHLDVLDARGEPLVHAPDEHPEAPGLHFVGYQVTLTGTLRLVGIQAKRLARFVAAQGAEATPAPAAALPDRA